MKLFDQVEGFPYLRWVEGFCIGVIVVILFGLLMPDPKPQIIKVPEVKVIEKPVIVKKPVYLSANDRHQIQCLAENAYFEAGNQSTKGKVAVTHVVMNRMKDDRFPKSACAVVHQKSRGVCQFSWVCDGKAKRNLYKLKNEDEKIAWAEAIALANELLMEYNDLEDVTKGATFFHAHYVKPDWSRWKKIERTVRIDDHIFYRLRSM